MATKEYYNKNKDWLNENRKLKYHTDLKYREKLIVNARNYRFKYSQRRSLSNRNYKIKNRVRINEYKKNDNLKFPEKNRARIYAFEHNLRDTQCKNCKSKKNLHFHHTNYKKNEGYTLCARCHSQFHNKIK